MNIQLTPEQRNEVNTLLEHIREGDSKSAEEVLVQLIIRRDAWPLINVCCEADYGHTKCSMPLTVIRVEREDDGSLTAITDYPPK